MIAADDPRHGSRAGYLAGCKKQCCRGPHRAYQKAMKYRRHVEGPQIVDAAPTIARLAWWAERGVGHDPIANAANLGGGTLSELSTGERDLCLRSTARATLAVTWDDLSGRALCSADLTRARLHSLQAAGHRFDWVTDQLPVPLSNRWRNTSRIAVDVARAVADLYRAAPLSGGSLMTQGKARAAGHVHPLAWDDPGTPAEPPAWVAAALDPDVVLLGAGVDVSVVTRILDGEYHLKATAAERAEVCRRWAESGRSLNELGHFTGWRTARYYRIRDAA